jgi:hypothetical protein
MRCVSPAYVDPDHAPTVYQHELKPGNPGLLAALEPAHLWCPPWGDGKSPWQADEAGDSLAAPRKAGSLVQEPQQSH